MVFRGLVGEVREELRRRILAGEWPLGARVYEEELGQELHVSRGSVREAVRMLEQEGLLVRRSYHGLFVASPTPQEIMDTVRVRALLEVHAVRWSRRHSGRELSELKRLTESMDTSARRRDVLRMVQLDVRFHSIVADVTTNATLAHAFHSLDGHMALLLHALTDRRPERLEWMGPRHRTVLEAVRMADPATVERVITAHYVEAAAELTDASTAALPNAANGELR
ncbi:MAG: GntR family transcriptional regulator [Firmicutes bacterium]|nr:GntR family transcriptional regulator [Bacillota bacterium]